MKVREVNK